MRSLQEIHIESASVMPLAFYDLKNVQTVRITSMPQETVRAQSFSFDSPTLKEVLLFNDAHGWKGQAQPGAYQGFPKGSRLRVIESETIAKEVYIGVLTGGGILDIPEPFDCDCRLAWLRLSPWVKQARVRCLTSTHPNDLENTPSPTTAAAFRAKTNRRGRRFFLLAVLSFLFAFCVIVVCVFSCISFLSLSLHFSREIWRDR
nr:uncharacterized protein LOC113827091 [Penaeus vannamei]